jgi:hypothetical protein
MNFYYYYEKKLLRTQFGHLRFPVKIFIGRYCAYFRIFTMMVVIRW